MLTLVFYFVISHIVSFVCSILEAVLLCCTSGFIGLLKKKNPEAGSILAGLKERIDRPLAAILTLNTAAHTFGAAGVGAQVVELYGEKWLAIVSVFLTLTMLFLTEMIPKTLGAVYWKKLAVYTAYIVKGLIFFTYPFVFTFEKIAHILSGGELQEKITEEEIKIILEEGTQTGAIREAEHDMMESIFRLGNRRVGVLMTPRMDIEWLDINLPLEKLRQQIEASPHTRFPVCDGDLDEVLGIVTSKDILKDLLNTSAIDLRKLLFMPSFVPDNMRVIQLVELFKTITHEIALVTDEYGGVQGVVTQHDVLVSIVGDSSLSPVTDIPIILRKDGSWLVDGMLPIDELKEQFDIEELPDDEKGNYRTLGGFCMRQIGSIPKVGDTFYWKSFKFKIVKMDGRRVEKVLMYYQNQ